MDYFFYDDSSGVYVLDYPGSIPTNGVNVIGLETIPTEGLNKNELYMAISLGNMFSLYYEVIPEISRIFYTSESGYTSFYPWTGGEEFYNKNVEKMDAYYSIATPENNPTGEKVWSTLYNDSSGEKNSFALSQPLYYGDNFLGVVSIEFSSATFGDRFTTDYDSYVVNASDQILGTNIEEVGNGVETIDEYFGASYKEIADEVADGASFSKSAGMYVEVFELAKSDYFYGFIAVPISQILTEAFVKTLPLILLGIILILALKTLENRKKRYTDLESVKNDLAVLSVTDPLTGINNRRKFDDVLRGKLIGEPHKDLHLAMVDLDYFKSINDKLGHDVGDKVLIAFAQLLEKNLEEYKREDVEIHFSRIGGEEFAVIFTGFSDDEVMNICEGLRASVESHKFEIDFNITISIGITRFSKEDSFTNAYKKADNKLYEAKIAGRNKVLYHK